MNIIIEKIKNKWRALFIVGGILIIMLLCSIILFGLNSTQKMTVEKVEMLIDDIGYVSENSSQRINKARNAYEDLDFKLKLHVSNRQELNEAIDKHNKLIAEKVSNLIAEIPQDIVLENYSSIYNTQKEYNLLNDEQKKLVKNYDVLEKAYERINLILVDTVIGKINLVKSVSLDSKSQLDEIEDLYEKIDNSHKKKVTNYDYFVKLKNQYNELLVQKCIDEIDALGNITLESERQLLKIKEIYNSLSSEERARVKNYDVFEEAQNNLTALKKKAEEDARTLKSGDIVTDEKWQFTYKMTRISAKILPNNTSGYYTYYTSDDDQVFVDMVFTLKNVSTDSLSMENAVEAVKVVYDGKYTYSNFSLFYSNGDDIDQVYSWDGMDALKTTTLHVAVAIPREAKSNDKPLTISLVIAGQEKIIKVR